VLSIQAVTEADDVQNQIDVSFNEVGFTDRFDRVFLGTRIIPAAAGRVSCTPR
jgi:hypothetical protein